MEKKRSLLLRFLLWREQHISQRTYFLILSALVGLGGGMAALSLKTAVFYLHDKLLANKSFDEYNLLVFIYPVIGIA
ncbi:MAG: hypothetical protein U9P82_11460 [Bacteroidota bacterium]|nr:hypothetical protein [Bacteroidota bacterium]